MLLKMSKGNTMSNITAQNLLVHLTHIHFSWETTDSFANATFIWSYFSLYVQMVGLTVIPVPTAT